MKRFLLIGAACVGLAACSTTTQPLLSGGDAQKAQLAWAGAKVAIGVYLTASHASPATVAAVQKAETIADGEIANIGSLAQPTNLAAVQADINAVVAALPAGTLGPQASEYVLLEQSLASLALTVIGTAPAAPAPAAG